MISAQTAARIERDYDYQSERVKNLLRLAYRDPVLAWESWEQIGSASVDRLKEMLRRKPLKLGRLNGKLRFNFLKDQRYRESEHALSELIRLAPPWKSAQLQMQQLHERQAEEHKAPAPHERWQAEAVARRQQRDKGATLQKSARER